MATGSADGAMTTKIFLDTHFARWRLRVYAGFTGLFEGTSFRPFTPEQGNSVSRARSLLVTCTWKLLRPWRPLAKDEHRSRARRSPRIFTEIRRRPNRLPKPIGCGSMS